MQIDTRNRDCGVTKDDIHKCPQFTPGVEPRQARYGRGIPAGGTNYSGVLECPCNGGYGGSPQFYDGPCCANQFTRTSLVSLTPPILLVSAQSIRSSHGRNYFLTSSGMHSNILTTIRRPFYFFLKNINKKRSSGSWQQDEAPCAQVRCDQVWRVPCQPARLDCSVLL